MPRTANHPKARAEAVTFTDLPMYPFTCTAYGTAAALRLAEEAAHIERPENNLALMELITGIAAIQNEEDRHVLALDVTRKLFTYTTQENAALLATMKKYHKDCGDE